MSGGAVSDVSFEIIFRVAFGKLDHVIVAGNFGDNGGSRDFLDKQIGFFEDGYFVCQWRIGEKIDCTVNNNLAEGSFLCEHVFDSAAGGEFERIAKPIAIQLAGGDPAEPSDGVFEN